MYVHRRVGRNKELLSFIINLPFLNGNPFVVLTIFFFFLSNKFSNSFNFEKKTSSLVCVRVLMRLKRRSKIKNKSFFLYRGQGVCVGNLLI